MVKARTPVGPEVFNQIVAKYGLDDREKLIVGYHIGVKDGKTMSFEQLGQYLGISRQRAHQIFLTATIGNDHIEGKMSKEDWERLEGTYRPNKPLASSAKAASRQSSLLRKYFAEHPNEPVQYGRILDKLGIPFDKTDNAYVVDEIESCKRFMEFYGIRHFGKYRFCTRCQNILPIDHFYEIGNTGRYYSNCRNCNTKRCREYARSNREKVNEHRRNWVQGRKEMNGLTS